MPRMISHGVEGGVAGVEPLANSVDFSENQLWIRVAWHESIHQRIQQRKEAPSHGENSPTDIAKPENALHVAKIDIDGIA